MRTQRGRNGSVVACCDFCANTAVYLGAPRQAEEKVTAKGWTVRRGKARCPVCAENERIVLASLVWRTGPEFFRA
jgi:hypothetical protein